MADIDAVLRNYGIRVVGGARDSVTMDPTEMVVAIDRLRSAVAIVETAWAELPPGVRAYVGEFMITLLPQPGDDQLG